MAKKFIEVRTKLFKLGITKKTLAEWCGVTPQCISSWYTGRTNMSDEYKTIIIKNTN